MKCPVLFLLVLILCVPLNAQTETVMDEAVGRAIQAGVTYLRKQQHPSGCWQANSQPEGSTALVLLALLKSGASIDDQAIKRGFQYLYDHQPHSTYSVSLLIMALEAGFYHRSSGSADKVPGRIQTWMKGATNWILNAWDGGYWGYNQNANSGDLSNTQFAVLALRSAAQCGIPIPRTLWYRLMHFLLTVQQQGGPQVEIVGGIRKNGSCEYRQGNQARGWGYQQSGTPRGSMTAAGVVSLLIAQDELKDYSRFTPPLRRLSGKASDDGLAWLALHFTVTAHPQQHGTHPDWHYYYLYSLERTGRISGLDLLGTHDWYQEGAQYILAQQQPSGMWQNPIDTCFALLFLTKATRPLTPTATRDAKRERYEPNLTRH